MMVDVSCDFCGGPMQTESTEIHHDSVWKCIACVNDFGPSLEADWSTVSR